MLIPKTSDYKGRTATRRLPFCPLLELLEARVVFASDFGDAPLPYPTLLAEGGAEHVAIGPMLGATRDTEADGVHSAGANGDDTAGIDDEDGVTFGEIRTGALGATATVTICCGPSMLDAWSDFNGDGSWGGPGEQIADSVSVDPGDNVISFDVPSWAVGGTTIARFRLSTAGNLGVGGVAPDGEVEDYAVTLSPPKVACGCFSSPKTMDPQTYGVGAPNSVYAVDVDGDSDTDILTASGDDLIAWFENDGSQNFVGHTISTAANNATTVFAVDVDSDGDTDVLSGSYDDDKIAWYENDGSQNFIPHTITTTANGARSVYATDVDGDGDIDVLSASKLDDKVAWYENNGNESFAAHTITTAANGAYSVYATDVDGDGDTDVLSASSIDNKIAWYENDGSENFTAHTITTAAITAQDVHATDMDGDGDTDVLSAAGVGSQLAWYENDGGENFTRHTIPETVTQAKSVYSADLDGDGDTDVLSASFADDEIAWYENDGSQNFTAHSITTAADGAKSVYALDVDGDGDTDVLSASQYDDKIAWYENDGSANFTVHNINSDSNAVNDVFAADIDGDGDTDGLFASDDKIAWYENDGSQNFTPRIITTAADGAESVYAADVDGDGDTDVLSASPAVNQVAWYQNDGNQNFTRHLIGLGSAESVYAADLDRDGDIDVLSALGIFDNTIVWYENDGNQDFTAHSIVDAPLQLASSVFAADVDSDGDLDVLSATDMGAALWHENDGSQNFTVHVLPTTSNGPMTVFAADVDGDGDTDVLSSSASNDTIAWYENDGSQNFTYRIITSTANDARRVYAVDMDGDSDIDVLSASALDNKIAWYENDGSQNFTAHIITTDAHAASSVFAADVDGDGDLDVLSASDGAVKLAWYENLNFVVVNTNDSGPGSLRYAILQANASPGMDTVTFSIGSGYHTIAPTSALPTITDSIIIDGTTQPGYSGAPLIEVWGLAAGPNVHGLVIAANDSTVKAIVVNLFSGNGVLITGSGNRIENSYIGTDVSGTIAVPNALNGVEISGGSNNTIGGAGAANIIAFNGGRGVLVDTGAGNSIRQNSIHSNDGLGIDLINGGNNNQVAPIVTRWTSAGGTTKVWLTLTSTPNTTFSIDVFRNTACDPSGFGEGEVFLGTAMLTTGAGGTGSIVAVLGVGVPLNQYITATATSPTNDTSEFSNCRPFRLKLPATKDPVAPLPVPPAPPNPEPESVMTDEATVPMTFIPIHPALPERQLEILESRIVVASQPFPGRNSLDSNTTTARTFYPANRSVLRPDSEHFLDDVLSDVLAWL